MSPSRLVSSLHFSQIQKYPPFKPPIYPDNNAFGALRQDSQSQRDADFTTPSTKVFSVIGLPMIPNSEIWHHPAYLPQNRTTSIYFNSSYAQGNWFWLPFTFSSSLPLWHTSHNLECSSFHISNPTHPLKLSSKTTLP